MKPITVNNTYGLLIGILIIFFIIVEYIDKGEKFFVFIFPNNELLNWRFTFFLILLAGVIVWYVMNFFWQKEFQSHQKTKFEKENLENQMKSLENQRLIDIVTGVPNLLSLEKDISKHLKIKRESKKLQFIFIDLRNFGKINKNYGFMKANNLIREIAQGIYTSMRRNEDMYKYPITNADSQHESFYRIHTGGDEFAFIIEGDQSDAIGFTNRLVSKFEYFTSISEKILGKKEEISFYAAIVEISPRDEFEDIINRAKECYRLAKEGKKLFTLSWFPFDQEKLFENTNFKKQNYDAARRLFEVILVEENPIDKSQ